MAYGPELRRLAQTWSVHGNPILAAADQLSQAAQNASQGGNTAGPGGHGQLNDPQQDPWLARELAAQEVHQFTKESTHLGTNRVTVLGHFKPPSGPNYIESAKVQGASYFDIPANLRQILTSANQWELNKQFLRDAVARGDKIIIGTKIDYQNVESWLFREINFLKEEFHLVLRDGVFVPGP